MLVKTCEGCRYVGTPSNESPCSTCYYFGKQVNYVAFEPEKKAEKKAEKQPEKQPENLDQEAFMAWAEKVLDNMLAKEKNNILAILSRAWKQGTLHPKSESVMDTIREALERSAVGGDKHEP